MTDEAREQFEQSIRREWSKEFRTVSIQYGGDLIALLRQGIEFGCLQGLEEAAQVAESFVSLDGGRGKNDRYACVAAAIREKKES